MLCLQKESVGDIEDWLKVSFQTEEKVQSRDSVFELHEMKLYGDALPWGCGSDHHCFMYSPLTKILMVINNFW